MDPRFVRNIGWVTEAEQNTLANKWVTIAGMGGVGGSYLLSLVRLGVGNFTVADFDSFEKSNFNRQVGAFGSSLGKRKTDTLVAMAHDINPNVNIKVFEEGLTQRNAYDVICDADVFLDGIDFYAFEAKQYAFAVCDEMKVPALTAAPIGMGVSFMAFMPGVMSFEQYFKIKDEAPRHKAIKFLSRISPPMYAWKYLAEKSAFDPNKKSAPSLVLGCEMANAYLCTQVLKILLGRGEVIAAPASVHFDAYLNKFKIIRRVNPLYRWILYSYMKRKVR
jgi:molybdopterin/thiamine biosynthesis adenylyltransferase